jgi:hypothetical protein
LNYSLDVGGKYDRFRMTAGVQPDETNPHPSMLPREGTLTITVDGAQVYNKKLAQGVKNEVIDLDLSNAKNITISVADGSNGLLFGDPHFRTKGAGASTPMPTGQTVSPTASMVVVDGKPTAFEAYNIGGNNFFKLRDIAYAVNGTSKQFSVGFDGAANAITLTTGQPYAAAGGEMAQGDGRAKAANPATAKVFLDGKELNLTAYNIGGNNFFRLRDLMQALDIGVSWEPATSTIGIVTSISYSEY